MQRRGSRRGIRGLGAGVASACLTVAFVTEHNERKRDRLSVLANDYFQIIRRRSAKGQALATN
jgi:hypothetical protein